MSNWSGAWATTGTLSATSSAKKRLTLNNFMIWISSSPHHRRKPTEQLLYGSYLESYRRCAPDECDWKVLSPWDGAVLKPTLLGLTRLNPKQQGQEFGFSGFWVFSGRTA
jgi:hypothetical protein